MTLGGGAALAGGGGALGAGALAGGGGALGAGALVGGGLLLLMVGLGTALAIVGLTPFVVGGAFISPTQGICVGI